MQKVSKQSLAMLALSILLAISIALTFTFAALNASKTATGTITFSGDASVAWTGSGLEFAGTDNVTFKLNNTHFDFTTSAGKVSAQLNEAAKTAMESIKVTFTNDSAVGMTWTLDFNVTGANNAVFTTTQTKTGTLAAKTDAATDLNCSKKLSAFPNEFIISSGIVVFSFDKQLKKKLWLYTCAALLNIFFADSSFADLMMISFKDKSAYFVPSDKSFKFFIYVAKCFPWWKLMVRSDIYGSKSFVEKGNGNWFNEYIIKSPFYHFVCVYKKNNRIFCK